MPNCYIMTYRIIGGSGKIYTTERYSFNSAAIERLYWAIKCPNAKLLCMKAHSGEQYLNNGRFV